MYTNTVQSLNNIDWKLFELQITLSKYWLAGTDGRTEKAISRPASAFGDAGKNQSAPVISHTYATLIATNICNYMHVFQDLKIDDFKTKHPLIVKEQYVCLPMISTSLFGRQSPWQCRFHI
jgi:hypothetical protein